MPLADQVKAAVEGERGSTEHRAAAFLLGETAATVVRHPSFGVAEFAQVVLTLEANWLAVEVFLDALSRSGVRPWPEDSRLGEFSTVPSVLSECLAYNLGPAISEERLSALEAEARAKGLVAYVWERQHDAALLSPRLVARSRFLAGRDLSTFAWFLESLPLRELRAQACHLPPLVEDRDAILGCLSVAPAVFDDDRWTGRVLALEALDLASAHADRLHVEVQDAEQRSTLLTQELPEWFRRVIEVAGGRPDGRLVLLTYACELVGRALRPRTGLQRWSSEFLALDAISATISGPPSVEEVRKTLLLGGDTEEARAATGLVTGSAMGGDARAFWAWYRDLLSSHDGELCSQAKYWRRALCYAGPAQALAALPDPLCEWREAWDALFATDREGARFDRTSHTALLPSVHLIRVASALLRGTAVLTGRPDFLTELRGCVRSLRAYDLERPHLDQRLVASEALDLVFPVFGNDWAAAIAPDAESILDDAEAQLFGAAALLQGGLPVHELESWFKERGTNLERLLAELEPRAQHDDLLRRHVAIVVEARQIASTRAPPDHSE